MSDPRIPDVGISEAARATGLSPDTIRYYDRVGLLGSVDRTEGNQRRFRATDLGMLRFVTKLRATGMGIRDIRRYVLLVHAGPETFHERLDMLRAHRRAVAIDMARLAENAALIDLKIDLYERGLTLADLSNPYAAALLERLERPLP